MLKTKLNRAETIFALTTGSLPSAVAVVRVSGSKSFEIANHVFADTNIECARGMFVGEFRDNEGKKIDHGLLLCFAGPASFTGEDVVEFQCHGSFAVVKKLEQTLSKFGARPAESGEFSYRAYLNGKLSSEGLENLGDVFRANSSVDLENIYRRHDGSMTALVGRLREKLTQLMAVLDTAVDFVEEYSAVTHLAEKPLNEAIHECSLAIQRYKRLVDGMSRRQLVIAGRSNTGKSSLFNALLCRYRALVASEPGTTRDVVSEELTIQGYPWTIIDTAGLREEAKGPERDGIELGATYLEAADAWILVVDGSRGLSPEDASLLEQFKAKPHLIVWNKNDLSGWDAPKTEKLTVPPVEISAKTGTGLELLWEKIEEACGELGKTDLGPLPTAGNWVRLRDVLQRLEKVSELLQDSTPPEYLSEEIRVVIGLLENIIGEVDVEDVLDRVFSEFCIGK